MVEIDPTHPGVDKTKPIQHYLFNSNQWVDCVLSADGKSIQDGTAGAGKTYSADFSKLRNTPFVSDEDVQAEYQRRISEANQWLADQRNDNEIRLRVLRYKGP